MQITLRVARISCGYTQGEVAKYIGVTPRTIRRWEKGGGDLAYKTLVKIRRLYGIPLDYIYFGSESEAINHNREFAAQREVQRKGAV